MMTQAQFQAAQDFASELRDKAIAIELMTKRVGRSRSLAPGQRDEVASHFGADRHAVGGSKRLYAPQQPEIKAITGALRAAREIWMDMTIGYRKGIRLLRKDLLPRWEFEFGQIVTRLDEALQAADDNRAEILQASREFLGDRLFNIDDYPQQFAGSVAVSWGVHNFEPSEELLTLAPETYQREQQRVRHQFEQAIACYEIEMREQMQKLVDALLSKLTDAASGKKVVYTEAATRNLRDFFDRFETLGIFSDAQLTDLVDEARNVLGDTTMGHLKKRPQLRGKLADSFESVANKLNDLITNAPARSISIDDLED